jgi:hypothetical protein
MSNSIAKKLKNFPAFQGLIQGDGAVAQIDILDYIYAVFYDRFRVNLESEIEFMINSEKI